MSANGIRMAPNGTADILALKNGKIYGLEIKNELGKQREDQISWAHNFTTNGGHYYIIRSLEDIKKIL